MPWEEFAIRKAIDITLSVVHLLLANKLSLTLVSAKSVMKITIIPFRSLLIIQLFSTLNCKPPEKNEESPIGELQNGGQEWVEEEWMSGEWMDEEWMDMLPNLESVERFEKHDKKECGFLWKKYFCETE